MTGLTYYDFCDLGFSSYFLNGFQQLAVRRGFQFLVSRTAPDELRDIADEMRTEWLWRMGSRSEYAVFRYHGRDDFLFCLDATDLNGDVAAGGLHPVLLERCRYYFKVNYNARAIANNPALVPYSDKIKPLPLTFRIAPPQWWRFLPDAVGLSGPRWPAAIIKRRIGRLFRSLSLRQFRQLRQHKKDIDVFCTIFLYPRIWSLKYEEMNLRRLAVIDNLKKLSQYNVVAGFVYYGEEHDAFELYVDKRHQSKYEQYQLPTLPHAVYLKQLARSRLGIYVRGADDCLSFKFGEMLAMGKPIVGETLFNNRAQLSAYPRFKEQFAYDEPEALTSRVVSLLENPERLQQLGESNENTFEQQLSPLPVMASVLEQLEA